MGMVVNNNIPALFTYNTVTKTGNALQRSIQKLSTGLRINSAADDAAGLAISEKMRAQVRGLDRAVSNSQDGISMIQTAEGALNETHSILQRMRELSVQSANDTLTQQDRGYIQLEIDQLREEITRIGNTTQFNKKKLLNGEAAVLWSSDDLNTKALVNGGLRSIDQFGQKRAAEGNYKITVKAEPGQGEVQKSDLFKIKHKDVVYNKSLDKLKGVRDVSVNNVPAGTYTVKNAVAAATEGTATTTGIYNVGASITTFTKAGLTNTNVANTTGNGDGKFSVTLAGFNGGQATDLGIVVADAANTNQQAVADALVNKLNGATLDDGSRITASHSPAGTLTVIAVNRSGAASRLAFTVAKTSGHANLDAIATALSNGAGTDPTNGTLADAVTPTVTAANLKSNANILFEVTDVDVANDKVTLRATVARMGLDGTTSTDTVDGLVLSSSVAAGIDLGAKLGIGTDGAPGTSALNLKLVAGTAGVFTKGSKFVYNIGMGTGAPGADSALKVSGTQNADWGDNWVNKSAGVTRADVLYGLKADDVKDKDLNLKNYYLNEKTGDVMEGTVTVSLNSDYKKALAEATLASFNAAYIGEVATSDVKLRDLDKFWNSEGVFMLKDPQSITVTQGDGKQAKVTLYANDTLDDVATKLNNAISSGLGQGKYVDDASKFVTYVSDAAKDSESVKGTFLVRSVVPGANGKLSLAGDEGVINAFSLNVIQDAKESAYTVSVKDAHDGSVVASDVKTTGNRLIGVLHPNIDVEFDAMAGVTAKWNDMRRSFVYDNAKAYETVLHLADNTTVFQIGANEGEDMGINIGDMRASALGLNSVLVTDRESAARSITIIDNAIDKVSTQRAKLGAYQNRLEHTISNLTTASENLTAAESRIRDTDMAKEMMNFTKLNIMLQAGNAMLAQANQLPQHVLSLIR